MTKSKTHKKKGAAAIITAAVLALIALFGMAACSNAAQSGTGTDGSTALPEAPFVEGGASLILSPDKLDIRVRVRTADGSSVTVEGCEETTLTSGTETVLHAQGTRVILKGKITELYCYDNQLTALNVQGLTALQVLWCISNQLTALNVQGLSALESLTCDWNRLTALNVQGLTALKELMCHGNRLTALDVQGCASLQTLYCYYNQLTALDVQGLTALESLHCGSNQLTELNVQGLTALQWLYCHSNRLTALDVQGLTALYGLLCYNNQLTELNVQGLNALQRLECGRNRLNADVFKKLFDDLPVRADSDEAKCILYTEKTDVTEGNHTDFTAPPDLADAFNNAKTVKKWKMYKSNGIWPGVEI
ncbi:leucine-rich repeat domain-containing protein [Treponema denticola]|uniref:Uncharacterized protein n=1 Tax=Treponema denticola SP33 TaxID=999437 RepID=M2BQ99_TREDN|nr:leucine-rich repeat domain-containing protein [Treponema denticola]EMB24199.1 hypothetical protein HMPREF9733_01648 [Treponema denticola SP33]EPF37599.1 hypothetical protein HMPREF9732_00190 [Treponema denticola SP32]